MLTFRSLNVWTVEALSKITPTCIFVKYFLDIFNQLDAETLQKVWNEVLPILDERFNTKGDFLLNKLPIGQ